MLVKLGLPTIRVSSSRASSRRCSLRGSLRMFRVVASFTLPQALRAQGLLKEAEHVESQSAETVLTPDECQLLGYLDKGKRKRKEKAGSLQWAYMAIARLGGFMDSKRTGIASWGALW